MHSLVFRITHPKGFIEVDFAIKDDRFTSSIELPTGVFGELVDNAKVTSLGTSKQTI